MKKKYIFSAMLCSVLASAANAQITVTRAHLVVTNQKVIQAADTATDPTLATPGANKTWDFSNLQSHEVDTLTFGNADWYPGYQNFPNANMALVNSSDDSAVTFLRIDNTQLSVEGAMDWSAGGGGGQEFHQKLLALPATFNSTWKDSSDVTTEAIYLGFDPDGPGPFPKIDSARAKFKFVNDSEVDGWGTLKTPLGDFPTIMVSTTRNTTQSFEMYTLGTWSKPPSGLGYDDTTTTEYGVMWWTNDAAVGFPLLEYSYEPGATFAEDVSWLKVKPATSTVASVNSKGYSVFPNPSTGVFHVYAPGASSVRVSDLQGKLILQVSGQDNFSLDLAAVKAGVYTLAIMNGETVNGTEKLIKK